MRVVLIGASGFVGSKILQELLDRQHSVKAIVRDTNKVVDNKHLEVESIDINKTEQLVNAITAADVVVSAYNAGWTNPNLYNDFLEGSKSIQNAVEASGAKRLIVIGGAGSLYDQNGNQIVDSEDFPADIKPGASAGRDYLKILKTNNTLDWTYFSPAIEMHPGTSGTRIGTYRTNLENPVFNTEGRSVLSAEDVAVAIVDEVENPKFIQKRFTAAY